MKKQRKVMIVISEGNESYSHCRTQSDYGGLTSTGKEFLESLKKPSTPQTALARISG